MYKNKVFRKKPNPSLLDCCLLSVTIACVLSSVSVLAVMLFSVAKMCLFGNSSRSFLWEVNILYEAHEKNPIHSQDL